MNGSDNVVPPLLSHSRPVNMDAARIFWKAPWWAKLPLEDKEQVIRTQTKIEDLVDVMQAPPSRPGGIHNQINDLRGMKMKNKKKPELVCLVLGYAYSRPTHFIRQKDKIETTWNGSGWSIAKVRGEPKWENEQRWYAFFEGEVAVIYARRWKMAGNYEPITPPKS